MTCLDYFFNLISRKDYSTYELLKKGQKKGFALDEITDAIKELQDKDYQSDTRLIAQMISSATGKYGKSVVKRKCLEKGINADVFEQIWEKENEEIESVDLTGLKYKVMRKYKLDNFQAIDQKTKAKLWNYLKYRGFNPFELLEQWQQEDKDIE